MNTTIAAALASSKLEAIEARALMRNVLEVDNAYLIAHASDVLAAVHHDKFLALIERRRAGEPIAYILGEREFFSLEFAVTPATLIPRPQTEMLVEFALEHIAVNQLCDVLDLGTGSGCVAVSIAHHRPHARVTAIDASNAALEVAHANAQRHATRVEFIRSDWFAALAGRRFDLIVGNPPYVASGDAHLGLGDLRFEPPSALTSGIEGLDALRLIIATSPQYLKAGGWLALEHGYDQGGSCRRLLASADLVQVYTLRDLEGVERISYGAQS